MSLDTRKTAFTTPNPTEVVAIRTFGAPRWLVFAAHTEPKHLQQWLLGPDGWSMPICEVDLRVGGAWRYGWRNDADGSAFEMRGVYLDVEAPSRVEFTETFEDYPESVNILEFSDEGSQTTLTVTMRYASEEIRDIVLATGMTDGMSTSYERLAGHLTTLS